MVVNKKGRLILGACFVLFLMLLSYLLFFSEAFGRTDHGEEYRYNLTLFREIGRFYHYGLDKNVWWPFVLNVWGNVAVFVPIGIFLPLLFVRCKHVLLTLLIGFEMSLLVELMQLVTKVGSFDVDDLFLNTAGVLLGYLLFAIGYFFVRKRQAPQ